MSDKIIVNENLIRTIVEEVLRQEQEIAEKDNNDAVNDFAAEKKIARPNYQRQKHLRKQTSSKKEQFAINVASGDEVQSILARVMLNKSVE